VHVAPRAGAWIETAEGQDDERRGSVAPRAGAWIETCLDGEGNRPPWSRPARARGLKHSRNVRKAKCAFVAPRAGAWIETVYRIIDKDGHVGRAPRGRVD